MDNLLMDRKTLGKFVDSLIKKKPLPANSPEELNVLREKAIEELDNKITIAIFSKFTKEQNEELNQLLDRPDTSEDEFRHFFDRSGINFEDVITNTIRNFGREFLLGGSNA